MAFVYTWDTAFEASPANNDDVLEGAARIRELKEAISERLAVNHMFALTDGDDQGLHKYIDLLETAAASIATPAAGYAVLFADTTKDLKVKLSTGTVHTIPTKRPAFRYGDFDLLTSLSGYTFTPAVAGYYLLIAEWQETYTDPITRSHYIKKNGANILTGTEEMDDWFGSASETHHHHLSMIVSANNTDYFDPSPTAGLTNWCGVRLL